MNKTVQLPYLVDTACKNIFQVLKWKLQPQNNVPLVIWVLNISILITKFQIAHSQTLSFYRYKVSKHHLSKAACMFCSVKRQQNNKITHSSKVDVLCEIYKL